MAVSQALANVQLFGDEGEDSERGQGEEADERALNTPRQVEDGSESFEQGSSSPLVVEAVTGLIIIMGTYST